MRGLWLTILFLQVAVFSLAQETAEDYMLYKFESEPHAEFSITTDTLLFYRALHHHDDMYDELAAFRFSMVDYARRGVHYSERLASVAGLDLRRSNISILRRLAVSERDYAALAHADGVIGGEAGMDCFSLKDGVPLSGGNVALFLSGKGYLGGVRSTVHSLLKRGLSMSAYASAKGGDDLYVKGVNNNSLDVGFRLTKEFQQGATLSFLALSTVGERGLRSGTTQETFTLTGDNLYNPSWGRQSDKVRNSRTRHDAVPFVAVELDAPLWGDTRMSLAVGGDYGHRRYSALGWYDAMTPRPDNYRYLPSYYADEQVAAEVAYEWRAGNENYTQVNWADMYAQNRRSADGAVYALESRVERIARAQLSLQFASPIGRDVVLNYGVRADFNGSRRYKQMDDLLGATHLRDVDYYLLDDDTYSNNLRNNLLSADDIVREGDRFGYDYELRRRSVSLNVGVEYNTSRWQILAALEAGRQQVVREGYFEKELYSGSRSLGRSARKSFDPYTFKFSAGYAISASHHIGVAAMVSRRAPEVDDIFLNPQYNNRMVDDPSLERREAVDVNYKFRTSVVDMVVSAFASRSHDERMVLRGYDDLSATYCDIDISGIGILRYGVEAAARIFLSRSWQAEVTASAGRYLYADNPLVSHYADVDNSVVCISSPSYMSGCRVGGAPQITASASLDYFARRGWIFSGGVNYAGGRYVEPSIVRRTERVARQSSASAELYERFLSQQRLGDAVTVDCSVAKWFSVGASRMSLSLMVRNLLGADNIVYGGYEQTRIRHYRSGAQTIYAPQDDIITYSYPRTFYAVVSWKF